MKVCSPKDSGIEWIGDVPLEWSEQLLKHLVDIRNGCDYKHIEVEDGIPVIGSGGQFAFAAQKMYDGEVIFLGRKGTIDRPIYYDGPFWAVDTMFYAIPGKEVEGKFLYYYAMIFPYAKIGTKTALPSMTQTKLGGLQLMIPKKDIQRGIVIYLDEKTAAIDARIAVLEKKIAAYRRLRASIINHTVTRGLDSNVRMKDSSVDWIGKVPEGWAIKRIKDDYFLKGRIGWQGLKANEFIDEGPWLITGTDFDNGKIDWSRCYHISEERYRLDLDLQIHEGDLLVTKDGTVGKLAYIDHVPGLCSLNSHLLLMRPVKRGIDNRFMYWVLSSNVFRHYIEYESNGSTMQSLSQEAVSRFSYSAPKMEEQLRIARYLDDECVKIDRKVELVAKEIELYRKLKRSLVNEVVTGKRKVA